MKQKITTVGIVETPSGSDRGQRRSGPGRSGPGRSGQNTSGQRTSGPGREASPPRDDRRRRDTSAPRDDRPVRSFDPPRPGLGRSADEPSIPSDVDTSILHRAVRAELRGLPKDLAEIIAGHLVVAGELIDSDPELAYAHAEAARRRAARLPIVREAAAETAYAAGRFDVALSEFRALRRMTGTHDYLPAMADCERALGRPHNALKLAREAEHLELDPALRVEMIIVEAGARSDLGQEPEARRILTRAVEARTRIPVSLEGATARLRYALAAAQLKAGETAEARRWFASAAELDREGETDAAERLDELDGFSIEFDEVEEEEEPEVQTSPVHARPDSSPSRSSR